MMISSTPASTADTNNTISSLPNSSSGSGTPSADSDLASEDTFLKLFVAQLQNQDPLNPNEQDPTQMVSELAQFSQLEQLVNIGNDVQSIDQAVTADGSSLTASQASGSSNTNNGGTTNQTQGS
jgi:flagellar basal-body rod modification protein FlgD